MTSVVSNQLLATTSLSDVNNSSGMDDMNSIIVVMICLPSAFIDDLFSGDGCDNVYQLQMLGQREVHFEERPDQTILLVSAKEINMHFNST